MSIMKDSGIDWIGKIPSDWELKRIQFCLNEISVKNNPQQTEQVLSLVKNKGVMLYEEKGNQGNKAKENLTEYKLAYPDTLVVNSMNILIGSVGISKYFGCVSPVYYVFEETELCDLEYINYIFNTTEFQKELRKYAKGILEIRLRVSALNIFKRKIPLPPKSEQQKISKYLNIKVKNIDERISKLNNLVEKYKEYKQSVITEVVTKGLNVNVEMKNSGIDWVGETPKHWIISHLKNYVNVNNGKEIIIELDENDVNKIDVFGSGGVFKYTNNYLYDGESVLFGRKGTIGKPLYVKQKFWTVDTMYYLTNFRNLMVKFNYYQLIAFDWVPYTTQTALPSVVASEILALNFAFPPLNEQKQIVEYLDEKCEYIDSIIDEKEKLIVKLEEYKKSLIYEYVTGKKEVPDEV